MSNGIYRRYVKKPFDLSCVIISAPVWLPIIAILALLVRRKIGSPVLFKQERAGLNGAVFKLAKFRSMTNELDENGKLLPDNQRLTHFGKFLRETSLDELPGLFQVLRGRMSLVGPRPLLPEYLELYSDLQNRRHEVLPGITGWAQINGRNAISWGEKFDLDLEYVNQQSFLFDMKILLLTFKKVIKKDNVNASNEVTMERFTGNHKGKE